MRNAEAYPMDDGTTKLIGNTFPLRDAIKAAGGRWDGRMWWLPPGVPVPAGIVQRVKARMAAHCHEPEGISFIPALDAERGVYRMGCGMCDTPVTCGEDVRVLEVLTRCPPER